MRFYLCKMDYIHSCSFMIFLYVLRETISVEYPEPDSRTFSGCHGDYMTAACDTSKVILVGDVEGGSKPNSNSCPDVPTSTNNPECCQYDTRDCLFQANSSGGNFLNGCNGRGTCDRFLSITTLETNMDVCDTPDYKIFSQYTLMSYYCVEEFRIGKMCENFSYTSTNLPIYIQSNNYPGNATVGITACDCSIETNNNNAAITVYTIHRTLYSVDGNCKQSLTFEDGKTYEISACDDNLDFVASSRIFSTSYIRLIWTSTASSNGGKFWMGFYSGTSSLTVNCPAVPQQYTTTTSTTTATTTTSTPSTNAFATTATEILATGTNTQTATTVEDINETTLTAETGNIQSTLSTRSVSSSPIYVQTETEDRYSDAFIATLCVIGFLLLVIIAGVCFLFIRKRESVKDIERSPGELNPSAGPMAAGKDTGEICQQEQETDQNEKEEMHKGPHKTRHRRYRWRDSGVKSETKHGNRQSIKTINNKIQNTVLIKKENSAKDIKNTEQKTGGLRKKAMKRKAEACGYGQNRKERLLSKLRLKQRDGKSIETVHRKMQNNIPVKQGSSIEEVKHLKQISAVTQAKSSKMIRSKMPRKISLVKSSKGNQRTKHKRATVKLETRSNKVSHVGPNTVADPEIVEQGRTIGDSETQSNSTENDPGNKISSVGSDTTADQRSNVSFITDKTSEGTVNGSSLETKANQPRKRKRKSGRRLSTVKQARIYESLLKVVTGSSFKASSFYK